MTGSTSGIGLGIATAFAKAGMDVTLNGLGDAAEIEKIRSGLEREAGVTVRYDGANLMQAEGCASLVEGAIGAFGRLDVLVNNAGMSPKGPNGERLTSLTTPVSTWMTVFHVNFLAPILMARGLFDELKAAQGAVVNVTSIVGSRVHPFAGAAYATSKAALACLTREMAFDFAPSNIRVNAIAPGEIKTDILSPETEARLAPTIPMRRIGTAEEVAKVIFFLCSSAASYVTGEEIQINGGQHV